MGRGFRTATAAVHPEVVRALLDACGPLHASQAAVVFCQLECTTQGISSKGCVHLAECTMGKAGPNLAHDVRERRMQEAATPSTCPGHSRLRRFLQQMRVSFQGACMCVEWLVGSVDTVTAARVRTLPPRTLEFRSAAAAE